MRPPLRGSPRRRTCSVSDNFFSCSRTRARHLGQGAGDDADAAGPGSRFSLGSGRSAFLCGGTVAVAMLSAPLQFELTALALLPPAGLAKVQTGGAGQRQRQR